MYKVIYKFVDLQDGNHVYNIGDAYPRNGHEPSKERVNELASTDNKIGKILIEKVIEKPIKKEEPIEEEPKPKQNRRKKTDTE